MSDHQLHRKVDKRHAYEYELRDGELVKIHSNPAHISENEHKTFECICGDNFRSEENALEHLEENDE